MMETLKMLGQWYNLVFVLTFGLGLLFLLFQTLGLVEHDHDLDHDMDVHDFDHDMDHDADGDHGHDAHDQNTAWKVLSILGVGKVPIMIILMSFCFIFGFTGYFLNLVLGAVLKTPWLFFWLSFAGAAFAGVFATGFIAKTVGKIMPKTSTHYTTNEQMIGKVGQALYSIDQKSGTIRVKDNQGNLRQFPAYCLEEENIPDGTEVLLVNYDPERQAFAVKTLPAEVAKLEQ